MQPSIFNVSVPLPDRGEVFLMNTFTDAQLLVSTDVVALLDLPPRIDAVAARADEQRSAFHTLVEHGFLVEDHASERRALDKYFHEIKHDARVLSVTVLTT